RPPPRPARHPRPDFRLDARRLCARRQGTLRAGRSLQGAALVALLPARHRPVRRLARCVAGCRAGIPPALRRRAARAALRRAGQARQRRQGGADARRPLRLLCRARRDDAAPFRRAIARRPLRPEPARVAPGALALRAGRALLLFRRCARAARALQGLPQPERLPALTRRCGPSARPPPGSLARRPCDAV
ncbi:hypothetical protein EMIHUDRAFT_458456, partial [Emiliania huxleyi CCMP1516]